MKDQIVAYFYPLLLIILVVIYGFLIKTCTLCNRETL